MEETVASCSSSILVPKLTGKVWFCSDPARLSPTLIWPVHRSPTLNDIFPKLTNIKYLPPIDASSKYHNLKIDEWLSYLTIFAWQFRRYRYKLSHRLQSILLRTFQYRGSILHKPGPALFIADWLSRQNNKENEDDEIPGIKISITAIDTAMDIQKCMTIQEIQQKTIKMTIHNSSDNKSYGDAQKAEMRYCTKYDHTGHSLLIWQSWMILYLKADEYKYLKTYKHSWWVNCIMIMWTLKKIRLLMHDSISLIGINADIENHIKHCLPCLNSSNWSQRRDWWTMKIQEDCHRWLVLVCSPYITKLCIVDYHSKLPIIKKMEGPSEDNLVTACKDILSGHWLLKKIMPDMGGNFISEEFKEFCKKTENWTGSIIITWL